MKPLYLSVALLALTAGSSHAADQIRWLNDWLPAGDSATIYYGVASGIFEEAGIDVTIDSAKGSSDAITRVATGAADVVYSGLPALMQAKVQGDVPVTAVMSIYNTAPDAIVTYDGAGIDSFADLKGKTVATATFSSSNVMWPLILGKNGLKPEDVSLQKVDPGALGAMLATGKVDAAIAWVPTAVGFEGPLKQTGKTMEVLPWSDFGLESYGASVLFSDKLIETNPELVKRFVAAYIKAEKAAKADPRAAVEALHDVVPEVDVDLAEKQLEASLELTFNDISEKDGLGSFEPGRLSATWDIVAEAQGLDKDGFNPAAAVDSSFLPAK